MKLTNSLIVAEARSMGVTAGAPDLLDRRFRSSFGTSIVTVVKTWNILDDQNLLPPRSSFKHLLWMLSFLKAYLPEEEYRRFYGCTEKTFRKWVWLFLEACASIVLVSTSQYYSTVPRNIILLIYIYIKIFHCVVINIPTG
jgi:hypothetical protein